MDEKKYLLDGEQISASRLIREAEAVDPVFKKDWLKSTSVAASILQDNGQEVELNPEWSK